ncbi:hypothetical protein ACRALDRAFT_1078847 [Sodiomyces alcalophilus JCM 7366]|uniref:uncharacterized protein n=1 Tax=Sodiomyces alcalophilus JCM 7366 TaxID=591952 RepID=UPI0039B670B2
MASPVPMSSMGHWGANGHQQPPESQQQHIQTQKQHRSQQSHHHSPYQQPAQPHPQQPPQQTPQAQQGEDGPQLKLMGLKVSYTIDGLTQANYLARHPQPLNVQTISLDQSSQIGIVDLNVCVRCVVNCSPELLSHGDYTVYAYDFSEPETPLVGQGMLSRILDAETSDSKFVVGRVTKNMLAALGGGLKDTLDVRFKLVPTARIPKPEPISNSNPNSNASPNLNYRPEFERSNSQLSIDPHSHNRLSEPVMTPTGTAEWNAFLQSNPQLGHQGQASNAGPAAAVSRSQNRAEFPHPIQPHRDSFSHSGSSAQIPLSVAPARTSTTTTPIGDGTGAGSQSHAAEGLTRIAPTPVGLADIGIDAAVNPPSRPSSRASTKSRKKAPSGRPRGRPRKNPAVDPPGSTSGYEDGTDADDGPPKKKRARISKAAKNINAPFGVGPDLLRVAASTSGSLRSLRPAGPMGEVPPQGSHLQEMPRAPTPVPEGGGGGPVRPSFGLRDARSEIRRLSTLNQIAAPAPAPAEQPMYGDSMSPPSQDGRSPDSDAMTPMYSDDSAALIGSSPPVPRTTPYIRSSPPPSSPILPPMPKPHGQPDSGFMSGGTDDVLEEPPRPVQLEPAAPAPAPPPTLAPAPAPAPVKRKRSRSRDTSHIPIQIFELRQCEGLSNDVEMVPYVGPGQQAPTSALGYTRPRAPGLERSQSANSRPALPPRLPPAALPLPLPPPTQQGNEAPSQPREPAAAGERGVGMLDRDAPAASEEQQSTQPAEQRGEVHHSNPDVAVASNARSVDPPMGTIEKIEEHEDQNLLQRLRMVAGEQSTVSEASARGKDSELPFALPPAPLPAPDLSKQSGPLPRPAPSAFRSLALPAIPASDPIGPMALPAMPTQEATSFSEAICPPSDAPQAPKSPPQGQKASKNYVKKASIRQKLEEAIRNGEMPPYCGNCGAIETPTWRKVWTQELVGMPEFCEFSEKPGRITAIIVLDRDEEDKVTKYQVIKKSLGPNEDKTEWNDTILCNPCGIWLAKWKCHRPPTQWDKDQNRLQRSRHRRGASNTGRKSRSRSKKAGSAGAQRPDAASEANFQTDPAGPVDRQDGTAHDDVGSQSASQSFSGGQSFAQTERSGVSGSRSREASLALEKALQKDGSQQPPSREHISRPGSTHSRGSGTAKSPINLEDADHDMRDMGTTRRLLFPSPRKDGVPKVLNDVAVNVVQITEHERGPKEATSQKENLAISVNDGEGIVPTDDNDIDSLFRSPMARPSTPPPKSKNPNQGPFKTPTRPTPTNRPITRSISRSIQSKRSIKSPGQATQQTPTRTPRSALRLPLIESPTLRRSPRFQHDEHNNLLETPMTRSISQLLSEAQDFDMGTDFDIDLSHFPGFSDDNQNVLDLGNLLDTDTALSRSPPRRQGEEPLAYDEAIWTNWSEAGEQDPEKKD